MKRPRRCSLWFPLLLTLTVVCLSGCGENKVNVVLAQSGKIVLHPEYGDRIIWNQPPAGKPALEVRFYLPSFCRETEPWIKECTVNVKPEANQGGAFNYICRNGACTDPEVDVGSSLGGSLGHDQAAAGPHDPPEDFLVAVPCINNTIQATPSDVPGDFFPMAPTAGQVLLWKSNGLGSVYLNDWTVTFDAGNANFCDRADIHDDDGYRSCKIKTGVQPGTYRYKAESMHCNLGYGTITLK